MIVKTKKQLRRDKLMLDMMLAKYTNRLTACLYGPKDKDKNGFVGFTGVDLHSSFIYGHDGVHFRIYIDYLGPSPDSGRRIVPVDLSKSTPGEVLREVKEHVSYILRIHKCPVGRSYKGITYGRRADINDRRNYRCGKTHRQRKIRRW